MINLSNWKTTLVGFLAGGLSLLAAAYKPGMNWRDWLSAASLVIFGLLAKDFNVTGGTVANKDASGAPLTVKH